MCLAHTPKIHFCTFEKVKIKNKKINFSRARENDVARGRVRAAKFSVARKNVRAGA